MGVMSTPVKMRALGTGLVLLLAASGCSTAPTPGGSATASSPAAAAPVTSSTAVATSAGATPDASTATSTTSTTKPASTTTSTSSAPAGGSLAVYRNADGSCTMPSAYAGKDFTTLPGASTKKVIALTFDGGASNAADKKILQVLADKGATATFFFTGKFAEMYPDTVKTIAATYPIGNHTYDHPYLTKLTDAQVAAEISKGEAAIVKASGGVDPVPYFRFPFGDANAHAVALVNSKCYIPFRWTIDTLGWAGTANNSAAKILALVNAKATPGGIILMHQGDNPDDHSTLDADALAQMIDNLRAKGYELVTLREALQA